MLFCFNDFSFETSKPHLARRRLKFLAFGIASGRKFLMKIASGDCLKPSNSSTGKCKLLWRATTFTSLPISSSAVPRLGFSGLGRDFWVGIFFRPPSWVGILGNPYPVGSGFYTKVWEGRQKALRVAFHSKQE